MWSQMTDQQKHDTLVAMRVYGGSFAAYIAEAWLVADTYNSARLAAAFPDLVEKYSTGDWV